MGQTQTLLIPTYTFSLHEEPVFESVFGQAVDDILSALGEAPKQAIYRHLEKVYGIGKEDIPVRVGSFVEAIEKTFGPVAKLLEIKIIEKLHSQYKNFCYAPKNEQLDFVEYVVNLQNSLESKA